MAAAAGGAAGGADGAGSALQQSAEGRALHAGATGRALHAGASRRAVPEAPWFAPWPQARPSALKWGPPSPKPPHETHDCGTLFFPQTSNTHIFLVS